MTYPLLTSGRFILAKSCLLGLIFTLFYIGIFSLLSVQYLQADEPPTSAEKKAQEDFELIRLFADALDQVERNYVKDVSRKELMEAAIKGMLHKLDPYSAYIPPEDVERFKTSVENEFGGIGITVSLETGELTVVTPMFGTPAYKAGIRAGDKILEIEGKPTAEIAIDDAVRQMKGKIGTSLKLTISHASDSKTETVDLKRELIRVDSVLGDRRQADDTWNFVFDEEQKIGYVRLISFGRHTADEMRTCLIELTQKRGIKGLVLDLRGNPGGLLTSAIEVSDLLLSQGKIVSTSGRNVTERTWEAKPDGTFDGFPLVVLVNRYSASSSEILAAALQDNQRGVVLGERTWGKGSIQNIVELDGGKSALKLTTAQYLRPSGKNIHRFDGAKPTDEWGVVPSPGLEIILTDEETRTYLNDRRERDIIQAHPPAEPHSVPPHAIDRQLQKALDYLKQELSQPQAGKLEAAKAE